MKSFEKIENLLNSLIIGTGKLLNKLVPTALKQLVSNTISKIKEKLKIVGAKLVIVLIKIFDIIKFLPNKAQVLIATLIEKLPDVIQKIKGGSFYKEIAKKVLGPVAIFFAAFGMKLKTWYLSLKPTTVAIGIVSTASIGIAVLNIVSSGKSIYEKSHEEPIEVKVKPNNLRAGYYKQSEKHLLVNGVTVPIYVGTGNAPKTLILDFTMLMSNRYLKVYFFKNDYLLKDRLNTNLEPVIPTLPLEDEGKRIIKQKIIDETNDLIKSLKIKGEVKDIYFHTIING